MVLYIIFITEQNKQYSNYETDLGIHNQHLHIIKRKYYEISLLCNVKFWESVTDDSFFINKVHDL